MHLGIIEALHGDDTGILPLIMDSQMEKKRDMKGILGLKMGYVGRAPSLKDIMGVCGHATMDCFILGVEGFGIRGGGKGGGAVRHYEQNRDATPRF